MLKGKYSMVAVSAGMRESETEKRERKPNVEVVIEGSCDVIGGDFGFD